MIPKSKRYPLRGNHEIFHKGKRIGGDLLEIFVLPSDSTQVAVSVGKRVSPLASKRNLVKRRIAHGLMKILRDRPAKVVVRALPHSRDADYETLESELRELLAKN